MSVGAEPAVAVALALACAACGAGSPQVLARGVLPYGLVAEAGRVVSVELAERFELVVRPERQLTAPRRLELGPPELDLRALAVHQATAYVGTDTGWIWEIDLATMARRRSLVVGAPVVALAANEQLLASADASGALCLRRLSDGALLQCALAPFTVGALRLHQGHLWILPAADAASPPHRWTVPALVPAPTISEKLPAEVPWRDGVVWSIGEVLWWRRGAERRPLFAMPSSIRAVVVTGAKQLVVAAWSRQLTDPAIVVWSR